MSVRHIAAALAALAAPLIAKSPEPVRLLSCVVSETGLLEAEVSNTSDLEMTCRLGCSYVVREAALSHSFEVDIVPHFMGRVGHFDTSSGRPGSYAGHLDRCHVTQSR